MGNCLSPETAEQPSLSNLPVEQVCGMFFDAMDVNSNGSIGKTEMLQISKYAFGETEERGTARWVKMLTDMDTDHNDTINKEEYSKFWQGDVSKRGKIAADGKSLVPGYAEYLSGSLSKLRLTKKILNGSVPAKDICEEFFKTQDVNGDGFISKSEILKVNTVAFGKSADEGEAQWATMVIHNEVQSMDKDHDGKISKQEYVDWWLKETEGKKDAAGNYAQGYCDYLLETLAKLWHYVEEEQ